MRNNGKERLHPLAIFLVSLTSLKSFIFPFLLVVITHFSDRGNVDEMEFFWRVATVAAIFVISLGSGWLHWLKFRYEIQAERQLSVNQGIFVKKNVAIPIERIQSVDTSENVLHRLFGTVRLQVQTAGGQKPEAVFTAITKQQANVIRELLAQKEGKATGTLSPVTDIMPVKEYRLPGLRLVLAGLNTAGFGIGISIVFTAFSQLQQFLADGLMDRLFSSTIPIMIAAAAGFAVAWLISVAIAVLRYSNFSIRLEGDRLLVSKGLLDRKQVTVPVKRIQAIRIVEEPIWQWFGFASVHADTLGYGGYKGESNLLHPLMRRDELEGFLSSFIPEFAGYSDLKLDPLQPKSRMSYYAVPVFITALAALIAAPFTQWAYAGIPVCLAAFGYGLWRHRSGGWRIQNKTLMLQARNWNRTLLIVPKACIQHMSLSQSPMQRRGSLSSIQVAVASGAAGFKFRLKGVDLKDGSGLLEWYRTKKA